ncbi:MAG TPA: 2-C-methyl-D-erythritol 4-phosphate cytidylyltransferase [Methylomirabilota bacterium]|nr:2-C-methyl-D-erythritol 4-phosphate cytidylyltransferase [Methylomirabilota bacterium]
MTSAVIVAGGKSARMGVDKLFLRIAGEPLIAHTWRAFDCSDRIDEVVLVIRPGAEAEYEQLAGRIAARKPWRLAHGGAERQDSVSNGLAAISPNAELVAIQDGARPCTTAAIIENVLAAARTVGAAVAAQKVTDTLKESLNGRSINRNVDRTHLWAVQTPQAFRVTVIKRALAEVRARGLHITDDTAACELIGQEVALVESGSPNPKATTRADLGFIEMLLLKGGSNEVV